MIHLASLTLVQAETAVAAWQLILVGRFRLLDSWCSYISARREAGELLVVSEDQWWQVLDFSRLIHEDLGNYDPNGAWSWVLDEFVEHLRQPVEISRASGLR